MKNKLQGASLSLPLLVLLTILFLSSFKSVEGCTELGHSQPTVDSIRVQHWVEDLAFLKKKFEQEHFELFRVMKKKEWNAKFERLIGRVDQLKDHEVITETMKILSEVGDGHSSMYPPFQGEYHFHQIPISFHNFSDGVFVKGASPEYKELVGKQVVSIGNVPIDEIMERLKTITPRDNDQWINVLGLEVYLTLPEILYALKLTDDLENVKITLRNESFVDITYSISADLFDINSARNISVQPGWPSARDQTANPTPLYLKRTTDFPKDFYWYEYIPDYSLVYFQLNVIIDKPDESLSSFTKKLFQFIENNKVQRLVVDIRLNSGGNNQLTDVLLDKISGDETINRKGHLFVVVGRRTFSAAMNLATRLEQRTNSIFVGEPTGSSPNFVGEDNRITLPHSGLFASASNRYWQDSFADDKREWITPDILNYLTSRQYMDNIDPNMDSIFEYITETE